jgi:hypothetical protein
MRGTAVLYDGTELPWVVGAAEQIKASRQFKIPTDEMGFDPRSVEYVAYMIFCALKRQGDVVNVGFETWFETLATPGMTNGDAEGESPAPPTA